MGLRMSEKTLMHSPVAFLKNLHTYQDLSLLQYRRRTLANTSE